MSSWLVDYPFADRLYPGALDAVKHVQQWGTAVILSDGDAVFQPRKVERSGLWRAFEDRVLIYVHKEQELDDVERLYPADHYVLIDDKLRILAAVKKIWGERVTTVFPKQGHYALDPEALAEYPPADIELAKIGDLTHCDLSAFLKKSSVVARAEWFFELQPWLERAVPVPRKKMPANRPPSQPRTEATPRAAAKADQPASLTIRQSSSSPASRAAARRRSQPPSPNDSTGRSRKATSSIRHRTSPRCTPAIRSMTATGGPGSRRSQPGSTTGGRSARPA